MALFFDDVHVPFEDLVRTRNAADGYFSNNLQPGDRAAIFTSSGQNQIDFTADRQKLHDVLFLLHPHPLPASIGECPVISEYQAYKIVEQDPMALKVAQTDALYQCCDLKTPCAQEDENYIEVHSRSILNDTERGAQYVFQGLEGLCRRMALLRGQRSIVFVSPGFFTDTVTYQLQQVIDRALRNNVVIGTLDARGLYVDLPAGDASQQTFGDPKMQNEKSIFHSASMMANLSVLASLASETGGVYYHDSNDYGAGFLRAGGLPEASYVLTFSPQNLKFDGSFHKLKVTLASPSGLTLQARHGYYAPRKAETIEDEIEEMVLSSDEVRDLPAVVNTSFFKTDNLNATLSVVARVDVSSVQFQKKQDRNLDKMTLVAVLFDSDGNYVTGTRVNLDMQFRDPTLNRAKRSGVLLKATLKVKAGTYLMRVVIRDSGSTRIAGLNQTVEIPL
jgi:VWFA-related protein